MDVLIQTLALAALIQGFLLGLLYLSSQKYNSRANRILGLYLFALVLEGLSIFLPYDQIAGYPLTNYFTTPEVKIFFPMLFLHYVLEKLGRTGDYWSIIRFNYGLGLLVIGLTLGHIVAFLFTRYNLEFHWGRPAMEVLFMSQQYYAFAWTIAALIIAARETFRYRRLVENEYSDLSMLEINWLWRFIFVMLPISLLWGIELGGIALFGKTTEGVVLATWGLLVLFIYWVSYQAFRHPNLFERAPEPELTVEPSTRAEPVVDQLNDACAALQTKMTADKYYRAQDLTIHDLAKETGISARLISTAINRELGVNFSEWVNQYRVNEAQARLEDPEQGHLSVEGIGADAGFKSRSAMYAAFKRHTGHSPGHFRPATVS